MHVARSQERANVQEFPKGSNWGPVVKLYLRVAGWRSPAPWCAAFVAWCLIEAGADRKDLPRNLASVRSWIDWAKRTKRITKAPMRGTLFAFPRQGQTHIGFMTRFDVTGLGVWFTLEGNTNESGGREGYRVAEKKRPPELFRDRGAIYIDLRGL